MKICDKGNNCAGCGADLDQVRIAACCDSPSIPLPVDDRNTLRAPESITGEAMRRQIQAAQDNVQFLHITPTRAAIDVLEERERQITAEGWTPEHDDEHENGELAAAAATYATSAADCIVHVQPYQNTWPWQNSWWKPTTPRRDLVKAAALILAEIERLDREAAKGGDTC